MNSGDKLTRLLWYLRRARSMSGPEVAHRVRERLLMARVDPDAPPRSSLADRPSFDCAAFRDLYAATTRGVSEIDATVRSRRLRLLGRSFSLDAPSWYADPDGVTWDDLPWTEIAYRNAGVDPKFTWEVHRLLYLLPILALGERSEDAEAAFELVGAVLEDWAAATRPNYGIAWTSGIEISLRLFALTVLAADENLRLSAPTLARIRAECSHGLDHLATFPSLFSSANNHRVAELVCRHVVGRAWQCPADVAVEQELARVADTLFGDDGAPLEQSSTYGAVTLELLGLAHRFAGWQDHDARRHVGLVIERGATFLAALTESELGILRYGDDDEWRILGVGLSEATWLETLSALFGHSLDPGGPGLCVFAEGGVSVVRTGAGAVVTFHHGPLGFGALAAHGHLDQLHVSLYSDGVAWLVDPGTYEYHRSVQWRNYFREADHHNGPHVEGDPVCVPTGPFNWAPRRPVTTLVEAAEVPSGARLAATTRSGTHPKHVTRRDVEVHPAALRVHDQGPAAAVIVSRFFVHPECRVADVDSTSVRLTHPRTATTVEVRVTTGELGFDPEGAWVSTGYAVKRPAAALTIRSAAPGEPLDVSVTWRHTSDQGVS